VKQRARTFYDAIESLIAIDPFYAFDDILFVDVDNVIGPPDNTEFLARNEVRPKSCRWHDFPRVDGIGGEARFRLTNRLTSRDIAPNFARTRTYLRNASKSTSKGCAADPTRLAVN
jgi:hypothetical protein